MGFRGIGKTRLVEEFMQNLSKEGVSTFQGTCNYFSGIYAPFREIVEQMAQTEAFAKEKNHLIKLHNQFRGLSRISRALKSKEERGLNTCQEEFLSFIDQVGQLLLKCASHQKLAFFFKDLQESDQETLQLIRYLLRNTTSATPILIYGALNQEKEGSLKRFLNDLEAEEHLENIPLYGLDTTEVSQLISSLLGMNNPPIIFARKVNEYGEGSPLFIAHLILWMYETKVLFLKDSYWEVDVSDDDDDFEELDLPEAFQTIYHARFAKLDPLSQSILMFLAFHGGPLTLTELAKIAGKENDLFLCFQTLQKLQNNLWISSHYSQQNCSYFIPESYLKAVIEKEAQIEVSKTMFQTLERHFSTHLERKVSFLIRGLNNRAIKQSFEFIKNQHKVHPTLWGASFFQMILEIIPPKKNEAVFEIYEWLCANWNQWEMILEEQKPLLQLIYQEAQAAPEYCSENLYLAIAESLLITGDTAPFLKLIQLATNKGARLQDILFVKMKYYLAQENFEEAIQIGENLLQKSDQEDIRLSLLLGQANQKLAHIEKLAYEDSQDNFQEVVEAGERCQDFYAQLVGYYELAKEALPNRPDEAKIALKSALELTDVSLYPTVAVQLYLLNGLTLNFSGKLEESVKEFQEGTLIAFKHGLVHFVIEGFTLLASSYQALGQMEQAKQSLMKARESCSPQFQAFDSLIRLEQARYYMQCHQIDRAFDELEAKGKNPFLGILGDYNFLYAMEEGHAYLAMGDTKKALQKLNKSISFLNPTKDWLFMACAFLYIGATHIEEQDAKKATVALSKADSLIRLLSHPFVECWSHYLQGLNCILKENNFLAKKFLSKALKIIQKYPNVHLKWRILKARGQLYLSDGQILEAREDLEKASEIFKGIAKTLERKEKTSFQKIASAVSLKKSLKNLEEEKSSPSHSTSPKNLVEAVKNRVSSEDDQDLEAKNKKLRMLLDITEKLNSEIHLDTLLLLIVETIIKATSANYGFLVLLENNKKSIKVAIDAQGKKVKAPTQKTPDKLLDQALEQEIITLPKGSFSPEEPDQALDKSVAAITLQAPEKSIGVLYFEWLQNTPDFTKDFLDLLTVLQAKQPLQ